MLDLSFTKWISRNMMMNEMLSKNSVKLEVAVLAGVSLLWLFTRGKRQQRNVQPPFDRLAHYQPLPKVVVFGFDIMPWVTFFVGLQSDEARKKRDVMDSAVSADESKLPLDTWDGLKQSPYTIDEVQKGKIWVVTYEYQNVFLTDKVAKQMLAKYNLDYRLKDTQERTLTGAMTEGPKAVELCKESLEETVKAMNRDDWTPEQMFTEAESNFTRMQVIKLNDGSLLLYAPCRIRNETGFEDWLKQLGQVEWIVIGSNHHTTFVASALTHFPEAKVIGSQCVEDKLRHVKGLVRGHLDFKTTSPQDLERLNSHFKKHNLGVQIYDIHENMGSEVMMVAHNAVFTCCVCYKHPDGGIMHLSQAELEKTTRGVHFTRLFKYNHFNIPNSPNGMLPLYRFQAQDPNGLGKLLYNCPNEGDCEIMANAIRHVLRLPFEAAYGTHFHAMSGKDFRRVMDETWNWLDNGNSLF